MVLICWIFVLLGFTLIHQPKAHAHKHHLSSHLLNTERNELRFLTNTTLATNSNLTTWLQHNKRQTPAPPGSPPGWLNAGGTTGPLVGINFENYWCERERTVDYGFPQALLLARAALQYMDAVDDDGNPDPSLAGQESFRRYFDESSRPIVRDALASVFQGRPADGVASADFDKVVFSLGWPLEPADLSTVCTGGFDDACSSPSQLARFVHTCDGTSGVPVTAADEDYAVIVLCRNAFIGWADLAPWVLPNPDVGWSTCKLFANGRNHAQKVPVGEKGMDTFAATIFHELMHMRHLMRHSTTQLKDRQILDYLAANDKTNILGKPENGYGPWNAAQLRTVSKVVPGMDVHAPAFNADSYTWFALEAYWGRTCKISFINCPQNENTVTTENEMPEPLYIIT